jgi:5-methylcytosine-specific restriction endonuclease McrA
MSLVFVLDADKTPLDPCYPARARKLLNKGKAAVFRRYPFTIILKRKVENPQTKDYQLKYDPGSKITGIAIIKSDYSNSDPSNKRSEVIFASELEHRGSTIKLKLEKRRNSRRSRRNRKTRYRESRFLNRKREKGWLAPSLLSRVHNIITWTKKFIKFCPITGISQELVRFDTQKLENPDISGIEYRQGELEGYEVREYLLEKFERKCFYCDKEGIPLQVEHIVPKAKGGTNRVSNLTIACDKCNKRKGTKSIEEFVKDKEKLDRFKKILKRPLKDAAAVNSTRNRLYEELSKFELPVEVGSGGLTKYNRSKLGLKKEHWTDAVCVGKSTSMKLNLRGIEKIKVLRLKAYGHGSRQMCKVDKYGFPRTKAKAGNCFFGFKTGDMIKATNIKSKYMGIHIGRAIVNSLGKFRLNKIIPVNYKNCKILHSCDGYFYSV